MKKLYLSLATALVALMMCACNSNDRLIDQYEQAMNEGNYTEARSILSKIDEDKLTQQQTERIVNIATGGLGGTLMDGLMKATQEIGGAMNEALSDAMEEEMDAVEDMLDELSENMED